MKESPLPSSVDLTLWLLTTLVAGFVVYLFVLQGLFRRFLFLSLYFFLGVIINIARCVILFQFGVSSFEYARYYIATDVLLTVFLFLAVSELTLRLRRIRALRWKIVTWAGSVLLMMACFGFELLTSYSVRTWHLIFETSQDLFFMCAFVVVFLWVRRFKTPADGVSARFVSVFAVYFLLSVLVYVGRDLAGGPAAAGVDNLSPMIWAWVPIGCGFALVSPQPALRL